MTRAWAWMKRWGALVSGVLLALVGAGWLWRHERGKRLDAEARAQAATLKSQIDVATAVRAQLIEDAADHQPQIDSLDEQIHSNERALLRLHDESPEEHDAASTRRRLTELGY